MLFISKINKILFTQGKKREFSFSGVITKVFSLFAVLFCIGIPVTRILFFWLLFIATFLIITGEARLTIRRCMIIMFIVLGLSLIKHVLPRPAIEEGHNVFVIKNNGEVLEHSLPSEVFVYMKNLFLKIYPQGESLVVPKKVFTFSADSVLSKPKYTRIVDNINFANLGQFRGGFANDTAYNWYGTSQLKRESMPFFVMYELSKASVGSSLCWRGHVLWETSPGHFQPLYQKTLACRKITAQDAGKRIFGISVNNDPQIGFWDTLKIWKNNWRQFIRSGKLPHFSNNPEQLAMKLKLSVGFEVSYILKLIIIILALIAIVTLTVKIYWKPLALPALFIIIASLITMLYCPHFFGEYFINEGGEDGLTHATLGRNILQYAMRGNWKMVLMGGEDVFYNTPGFRYFRALEKFVFGDTNFGYLIVILLLPYIWFGFMSLFIPARWAFWATVVFLFKFFPKSVFAPSFGFSYFLYLMVARGGWPDTLGYTTFLAALWLMLKYYPSRGASYLWHGFLANFLFSITVFMRPNFSITCLIIVLYFAIKLVRERRFKEMILTTLGFLPSLLPLLHNYWFGQKILFFTSAQDLAVYMKPSQYLEAFRELIAFNFNGENYRRAIFHIQQMMAVWYRYFAIIPVVFALFIKNLRFIALVCLSLHATNLFLGAVFFRYVFLAWALTIMVAIFLTWELYRIIKVKFL